MPTVRDRINSIVTKHAAAALDEAIAVYRASLDIYSTDGKRGPQPAKATARTTPRPSMPKKRIRRSSTQIDVAIDRVLTFLDGHPDLTAEQIIKQMGGDKRAVSDALARLRAGKKVRTKGQKRSMTYQL